MTTNTFKFAATLAVTAASLLPLSQAQAAEFTLGAGAFTGKSEYKDFKDQSGALPLIQAQGDRWSVDASGVSVELYGDEKSPLTVNALLTSAGSGFDEDDSDAFSGMKKRKSSVDLGLQVQYQIGQGAVEATVLGDVSSTHKGYSLDMNYSHNIELMGGFFQPAIGFEFTSAKFTDYYYGVKDSEATATRSAYKAESAINPYLEYSYIYPVNKNINLIHGSSITKLDSEVKNSSIVDRSTTWNTFVGLSYTF